VQFQGFALYVTGCRNTQGWTNIKALWQFLGEKMVGVKFVWVFMWICGLCGFLFWG
jgi:hypothetical protein